MLWNVLFELKHVGRGLRDARTDKSGACSACSASWSLPLWPPDIKGTGDQGWNHSSAKSF